MVDFKIFQSAIKALEEGDVWFIDAGKRHANFIVQDVPIRVEITPTGTKFNCQCKHHMKHQLQDKLCKRVIAVIMYMYNNKGKFKRTKNEDRTNK